MNSQKSYAKKLEENFPEDVAKKLSDELEKTEKEYPEIARDALSNLLTFENAPLKNAVGKNAYLAVHAASCGKEILEEVAQLLSARPSPETKEKLEYLEKFFRYTSKVHGKRKKFVPYIIKFLKNSWSCLQIKS